MRRFLGTLAVCIGAFIGMSCDCEEEFLSEMDADSVIEGKVLDISEQGDLLLVTLMTDGEMFYVHTPTDADLCGYPFTIGEDYIVFAYYNYDDGFYGPAGSYHTTSCTFTMTSDDWAGLGEGW